MEEFFGSPSGKMSSPSAENLTNDFATISDRSVADMAQSDRVVPRQLTSGVMRGTQRVVNTDGSTITLGVIPETNGDFGIATFNDENELLYKLVGNTWLWNDISTDKFRVSITATDDDFSMKVSQNNVDVRTATDSQLVFNSANNLFKIVATGVATVPAIAAAPASDSFTVSSVDVATGIETTEPLAFFAYGKLTGGTSLRMLPFHQVYTDGAQGARIGSEWELASSVISGQLSLNIAGRNYQNTVVDELLVRWYAVRETAAVD